MTIELSDKEFRRLLDLIYIGDWILNSTRGDDRFEDYDLLQEKFFALAGKNGMKALVESYMGHYFPSKAYEEGGIHEAIADYEDAVFFDILAEELARRDMLEENVNQEDMNELTARMNDYMDEFEKNGVDRLTVEISSLRRAFCSLQYIADGAKNLLLFLSCILFTKSI